MGYKRTDDKTKILIESADENLPIQEFSLKVRNGDPK